MAALPYTTSAEVMAAFNQWAVFAPDASSPMNLFLFHWPAKNQKRPAGTKWQYQQWYAILATMGLGREENHKNLLTRWASSIGGNKQYSSFT